MTSNNNDSTPPPLTPEQESKRATALSSLYPESSGDGRSFTRRNTSMEVKEHIDVSEPIGWRGIIIATVVLSTLLVLIDIGYELLIAASRQSPGDGAVVRMFMVLYVLAAFLAVRLAYKKLIETLETSVVSPRLIIGMSLVFVVPLVLFARGVAVTTLVAGSMPVMTGIVYSALVAVLCVGAITLFIGLTDRTKKSQPISVVPVVLLILAPYIAGLLYALVTSVIRI